MKRFTYFLLTATLLAISSLWSGVWAYDPLLVGNGTNTTSYSPFYGNYVDKHQRQQIVYAPTDLAGMSVMSGKDITSIKFYQNNTAAWSSSFTVSMAEISGTGFDSKVWFTDDLVQVYSGTITGGSEVLITFDTPFNYGGGNLLVDIQSTSTSSNYQTGTFLGNTSATTKQPAAYAYNNSLTAPYALLWNLPKTTFTYVDSPCSKPGSFALGAVSSNSATFTWTAGASETSWQWVCLPAATAVDWSDANVQTTTSATATATELTASSDYKFYLRSYCSAENQSMVLSKAFKTPCAGENVGSGWSESFESTTAGSGNIPDCWGSVTFTYNSTVYPCVQSSNSSDGSKSLAFYGGTSSGTVYAILPPFTQDIKDLTISFDYKNGSTSPWYPQQFSVGYVSDPSDMSTYKNVQTFAQSTSYVSTDDVNFPSDAPTTATNIVIRYAGNQTYSTSAYIDNIKVNIKSSCTKPTEVSAEAVSATSASVSWIAGGSEASWNLQYSTDQSSWTAVNGVTANPYTLTGLSANTTYYVQVQADCGGSQSGWTSSVEVTTPCAAVTGVGWSQNFNDETAGSGEIPACWKKIGSSYPYVSSSSYYRRGSSGNCLYFYGGTSTSEQIAILPEFTEIANETKTLQITLWYSNYSSSYTGSSYASPQVGYITDPTDASTFEAIETLAKVSSYTEATVELPSVPAGACVAIRYGGGSSDGYLCVDDISVSEAPSCLKPTGVAGSATAYNQASISWTENGSATAWKLQYSSDNGENWSDEIAVTTNPYTLTDLSSNTLYVVRVKANCGGSTSAWSAKSAVFMTPCGLADGSNYTMGFETSEGVTDGTGKLPGCWEYLDPAATNPYVYNSSSSAYEGSNSLYFYGGTSSTVRTVILPEMNRDINTLSIEFYYKSPKSDYSTYPQFTLGYIAADGTTFKNIETLNYASDYTHYKKALTSADDDAQRIAIRYSGSSSSNAGAYIDNIHVFVTPSCIEPTAITASNLTANSAEISWTAGGSETVWKLQYSTDGSNWTNANSGNDITTNPYTLSGLSANTTYYARVKAVCNSSDVSEWSSASAAFKTACAAEALPFNENFSGAITCWKIEDCASNTGINSGAFRFAYPDYPQYLITPELEVSARPIVVEFSYKVYSSSYTETFSVGYSTTTRDVSAFTFGAQTNCTNTEYATYSENLPAGTKYVAIKYNSNDKYYLYIDDFSVDVAPTCPKPTAVTVSSVTAHTASVSWTNGGSETAWKLQTSTDGTSWGAEIAANTKPFSLTGLEANTTYYVRVKADCGGGDQSAWSNASEAFTTECEKNALGWKEGFEGGSMPGCWSETHNGSYGWSVSTNAKHRGAYSMCLNTRSANGYPTLVTPTISVTGDAMIEYWHMKGHDATITASVQVFVNGTKKREKAISAVYNKWNNDTIHLFGSDYVGKDVVIKFVGTSNGYSRNLYIDDIRVARTVTISDNADNGSQISSLVAAGETTDVLMTRSLIKDGDYNPLCLPFSLSAAQLADAECPLSNFKLKVFDYIQNVNDEIVIYIAGASSIEAGVPYFVSYQGSPTATTTQLLFRDVTFVTDEAGSKTCDNVTYQGTFSPTTLADQTGKTNPEILFLGADNTIYWPNENVNLKGFRAYFTVDYSSLAPGRRIRGLRFAGAEENAATSVDALSSEEGATSKRVENNQVVIIRDGVKYTVLGQPIR